MFTPPVSPNPTALKFGAEAAAPPRPRRGSPNLAPQVPEKAVVDPSSALQVPDDHQLRAARKRQIGRQFRLAVILVPLVLAAITITAQILTANDSSSWSPRSLPSRLFRVHSRHTHEVQLHRRQNSDASSTIPTIPATPPPIPTPFIQSFDGELPLTFSSQSCYNFFSNMTNAREFRTCRPFSMLLQTSNDFIAAQTNITYLNEIVWGTCNTNTPEPECIKNMAWFATHLRTDCATDLQNNNAVALSSLIALEAYEVMREAGCLSDPTTNTYCYVNAARDSSPSSLYYYSLPLGLSLPESTDPQCTACLKSLMTVYSTGLKQTPSTLPGLMKTYEKAAELTLGKCGVGYALTGLGTSGAGSRYGEVGAWRVLGGVVVSLVATVLAHGLL